MEEQNGARSSRSPNSPCRFTLRRLKLHTSNRFKWIARAPLGYSAESAPLGGQILPPCLTPERMVVERWEKRQAKALNKTNIQNIKKFT